MGLIPGFDHVQRQRRCSIAPRQFRGQHRPQLIQRVRDQCAGQEGAAVAIGLVSTGNVAAGVFQVVIAQRPNKPFATSSGVVM